MLSQATDRVKTWLTRYFQANAQNIEQKTQTTFISIPITTQAEQMRYVPVHFSGKSKCRTYKLAPHIIAALGGLNNIESYREIPNSRRIRLTLINPSLIDNSMLEEADVRMFIRIGKRIVHIIP